MSLEIKDDLKGISIFSDYQIILSNLLYSYDNLSEYLLL